jgi:C4-dicarboxylate-specific signal transduction histidine kinase
VRDLATYVAGTLGALGVVALAAGAWRAMARRRCRSEAAVWQDATRIADLSRAAAVGELEAWVAREIGAPVTSLLANLGAARRLLGSGERGSLPDVIAAVDEARSDGERAAHAVRRIRQLLGAEAGRREPLDLNDVAREATRLVARHAAAQRVTVTASLARGLPRVTGDPNQILQVALSLILQGVENASTSRRRSVAVRTSRSAEGAELEVGDSGAPVSEIDRAHLSAPFRAPGTGGLGIDVVRSIVDAHGGRLAVERPESGALLRVVLPCAGGRAGERHGGG